MLPRFRQSLLSLPYGRLTELAEESGFYLTDLSRVRWLARLIHERDPRIIKLLDGLGLDFGTAFGAGPDAANVLHEATRGMGDR